MKVVFVGANDGLGETLVERLGQEGHDVYMVSDEPLARNARGFSLHRHYRTPRKGSSFVKLLHSISPDCVVFAGKHYIHDATVDEAEAELALLAQCLHTAMKIGQTRFVLLSSVEVYGSTDGEATESAPYAPDSERGFRFVREEQLVEMYRNAHAMDTVILRASALYSDRSVEGDGTFLSRAFAHAEHPEPTMLNEVYQPLHVGDFADAVKRALDSGVASVYNVTGSEVLTAERLYGLICDKKGWRKEPVHWDEPTSVTLASSDAVYQALGWRPFRDLDEQIERGEISYEPSAKDAAPETRKKIPAPVRQLIENVLLFAVFLGLQHICRSHEMFSRVDWMMIYIIIVGITYDIYESALAGILAAIAILAREHIGLDQLRVFTDFGDVVVVIAEYVLLGFIVSYTCSKLREEIRDARQDIADLRADYNDLVAINDENVLIKNEYEQRILTTQTGFPKLYSMVSRLLVQEPDRILMETMQIISELVRTNTVAVYQARPGSPWLRLMSALNEESAMSGKSWNLSTSPKIYDAVMAGELYQGEFGTDEPAMVLPIMYENVPEAVVVIRRLPYESETLYHVNLLKTMSLLLHDSMEKALQYEELSRVNDYVENSNILKPAPLQQRVSLAREKAERGLADYCLAELKYTGSMLDVGAAAARILRQTDCIGMDESGALFALLNNADPKNIGNLKERLKGSGVTAVRVVDASATAQ